MTDAYIRLRRWIKGSAYDNATFAAAIGVHPTTLRRILTGETARPDARTMHQIAVRTGNAIATKDWFDD